MIARVVLISVALLSASSSMEAGFWDSIKNMIWKTQAKSPPMIDILIVNDKPGVLFEVKGRYQILDPYTKKTFGKRYVGKRKYLQSLSSGIKWGEEFPGVFQILITPDDAETAIIVDNVEYKGMMYVYDIGGTISIVNRVPIEEYLLSTLPASYDNSLPQETLAALAIAARTDAVYKAQNPKNRYWSVDAEAVGYRGVDSHVSGSEIAHAVQATRHMVLSKTGTYEGVITAFPAHFEATAEDRGDAFRSRVTLPEAGNMARNGHHAAQILSKAFPGSRIEIIY